MQMQEIAWRWIHREDFLPQEDVIVQECLSKFADFMRLWVFPSASLCMFRMTF